MLQPVLLEKDIATRKVTAVFPCNQSMLSCDATRRKQVRFKLPLRVPPQKSILAPQGGLASWLFDFCCQASEPSGAVHEDSTLNFHVPALSVPPRRPPRQASDVCERQFYFNDISFDQGKPRRSCSVSIKRHHAYTSRPP